MGLCLDQNSVAAMMALPYDDGTYTPEMLAYLTTLRDNHKSVIFTFPPKCGGTFLRSASIWLVHGALYRTCYSQGGRESQFYLPTFLKYYLTSNAPTMVTHVHMHAHRGNLNFIEALDLKPVAMIRSISDMLVSYHDMFLNEAGMISENVSCVVPREYPALSHEEQADFLIYMMAPWYVAYFASWFMYAGQSPDRVLMMRFSDLQTQPADVLQKVLKHSGFEFSDTECQAAVDALWKKRQKYRFNKGVSGRGHDFFTPQQFETISIMMKQYSILDPYHDELL